MAFPTVPFKEGAREPRAGSNRRASVRYHCGPATPGRIYLSQTQEFLRAWVLDLSRHGMGLIVPRPLEVGQQVTIKMKNATGDRTFDMSAEVVHVNTHPHGEWVAGFEFATPLDDNVLDAILG
jgi:hypothetical protein